MRLKGKVAFITGGTSGIGLATAKAFLREGAQVVVTGRDANRLQRALHQLGEAIGYPADAANEEDMRSALEATATKLGGIDILFANAGHYVHTELGGTSRAAFASVLETNLTGVFFTVQAACPSCATAPPSSLRARCTERWDRSAPAPTRPARVRCWPWRAPWRPSFRRAASA